jgi:hypothetical protein
LNAEGSIIDLTFAKDANQGERRGGYYVVPPLVWLEDPEDHGQDAEIAAILDGYGRISELRPINRGRNYSSSTRVRISTHHSVFAEQAIAPAERAQAALPGPAPELLPITYDHALGDPWHRGVDYVAEAFSAFRSFRKDIRWQSRRSLFLTQHVPASSPPSPPEIASLMTSHR